LTNLIQNSGDENVKSFENFRKASDERARFYFLTMIFSVLFFITFQNTFSNEKENVVVLPFTNKTEVEGNYAENLTSQIEERLIEYKKYSVISRSNLKKVMEEQKLSMLGMIQSDEAIEIGKIAGAKKA